MSLLRKETMSELYSSDEAITEFFTLSKEHPEEIHSIWVKCFVEDAHLERVRNRDMMHIKMRILFNNHMDAILVDCYQWYPRQSIGNRSTIKCRLNHIPTALKHGGITKIVDSVVEVIPSEIGEKVMPIKLQRVKRTTRRTPYEPKELEYPDMNKPLY